MKNTVLHLTAPPLPLQKNLIIFDIDMCVLDPSERLHHYLEGDYSTYDSLYYTDKPIESGIQVYSLFLNNPRYRCLFVTSRSNACRKYTLEQLNSIFKGRTPPILDQQLLMRPKFADKNFISDVDFKPWLIEHEGYSLDDIVVAFDDRDTAVEGYRSRNIVCYQTDYGSF